MRAVRLVGVTALACLVLALDASPVFGADNIGKNPSTQAELVGPGSYSATAIRFSGAVELGGGNAGLPIDWEPPICWYEPTLSSTQMRSLIESSMWSHYIASVDTSTRWQIDDLHEGDEGRFWTPTCANEILGDPELSWLGQRSWAIWVGRGDPLPPGAITPQMLAEIVRANLVLPEFEVGINPPTRSVVNLPTWVWAAGLPTEPLTATASLPNGPAATVTARPVGLAIEPGTESVVLYPEEGRCEGTGQPYQPGLTGAPECGVMYLRPTTGLPEGYQLRAELVWEVTWEGNDGSGGVLPEGRFGGVRQVPVAEIQTVVER